MLTLHQVLRCQSPDGTYTIDIIGNPTRDHRCFNLDSRGKLNRLSKEMLSRMEKGKVKIGKEISEGADQ